MEKEALLVVLSPKVKIVELLVLYCIMLSPS